MSQLQYSASFSQYVKLLGLRTGSTCDTRVKGGAKLGALVSGGSRPEEGAGRRGDIPLQFPSPSRDPLLRSGAKGEGRGRRGRAARFSCLLTLQSDVILLLRPPPGGPRSGGRDPEERAGTAEGQDPRSPAPGGDPS